MWQRHCHALRREELPGQTRRKVSPLCCAEQGQEQSALGRSAKQSESIVYLLKGSHRNRRDSLSECQMGVSPLFEGFEIEGFSKSIQRKLKSGRGGNIPVMAECLLGIAEEFTTRRHRCHVPPKSQEDTPFRNG